MKKILQKNISTVVATFQSGGVAVIPTDTIYGIVASALDKKAVARVYRLRRRNLKKPMIILISDIADLSKFGIRVTKKLAETLAQFWPGKVSVIMPCGGKAAYDAFAYLHRGGGTLAFRLPKPLWLRNVLKQTGPLVAPSANFEGEPPAKTVREAKKYFKTNVDFYIDGGESKSLPSTILKIEKGKIIVIRRGSKNI